MWIIGFLTLVMPWLVVRGIDEPFLAPKLLAWLVGCWGLILSTTFLRFRQITCVCRPLLWFGIWVLAIGILGFYLPYLFRPTGQPISVYGDRWLTTVYVLTALVSLGALQAYVSIRPCVARISAWCCWTAFAMAVYQSLQWFGLDQFYTQDLKKAITLGYVFRPYAGLGNIQFVAITQAMILPFFFLFQSPWYLAMGGSVLLAIALSGVALAQVGAGVVLLAYGVARLWYRWPPLRRATLLGLCAILLAVLPWGWHRLRTDERWALWSELLYQWKQPSTQGRPMALTGWGLQSFPERFWVSVKSLRPEMIPKITVGGARYDTAHSDVLQALYELGLIGIVLLLGVMGSLLWRGWRLASAPVGAAWWASGLGVVFFSVFYFIWHMGQTAWLATLIVAMNCRQPEGA